MDTASRHLLVELFECTAPALDDPAELLAVLRAAVTAAGATPVGELLHRYRPQGVSGVVLIAESHLSVHTWPEARYAAADFHTCGELDPRRALPALVRGLGAGRVEEVVLRRGTGRRPEVEEG